MKERKCTVGMLAHLAGMSSDSIRHYEKIGILPRAERSSSGYRLWDPREIQYLKWIGPAKHAGFTLRELAEIFRMYRSGVAPCRNVRDLLQLKLSDLHAQILELTIKRRKLKKVLTGWNARLRRTKPEEFVPLFDDLHKLNLLQTGKSHKNYLNRKENADDSNSR